MEDEAYQDTHNQSIVKSSLMEIKPCLPVALVAGRSCINKKSILRQLINIRDISEAFNDVIYLSSGDCALIFVSVIYIISLKSSTNRDIKKYKFQLPGVWRRIYQLNQCIAIQTWRALYFLNKDGVITEFKLHAYNYPASLKYYPKLKYLYLFNPHQNQIQISDTIQKTSISITIQKSQKITDVDDESRIAIFKNVGAIQIINLKSLQRSTLQNKIQFQICDLYFLDEFEALCVARKNNTQLYSLFLTELASNKKPKQLKYPLVNINTKILSASKQQSLAVIQNDDQIYFYDYSSQMQLYKIYGDVQTIRKRTSRDLMHSLVFVRDKKTNKLLRIIHNKLISYKKIYLHLYQKSKLKQVFGGDSLFKQILKTI